MLWKVLVPLCLLCLSGLASGGKDYDYIGKHKPMSLDTDYSVEEEEVITENYIQEEKSESQNEEENVEAGTEIEEEKEEEKEEEEKVKEEVKEIKEEGIKGKDDKKQEKRRLDTQSSTRSMNSSHIVWLMQNTFLRLYTRNHDVEVVNAHGWFKNFVPDRDVVIIVHGATKDDKYIDDYFNTLSHALLNETNYNIIGVDWKHYVVPAQKEGHLATNIHYAKLLGIMINFLFEKRFPGFFTNTLNTYYIGEDLGTIPPITFEERYRKPFQYVYGLNPRRDMPHTSYRLAQEHGEVVAILSTNEYPYAYAHKNIYPVPFGAPPLPPAYKILAKVIINCRRTATFCPTANHFTHGYCDVLPHIPIWFTHAHTSDRFYPIGNYYFYEFPEK